MKRKSVWVLLVVVVGAAVYGGNVLATISAGFTSTTVAKSTLGPLDIKAHTVVPADPSAGSPATVWETMLKTKGSTDMYIQQNTWLAGGSSGWHTHPGPSLVVDIGGGDVHLVRNETGDVARGYTVQFGPKGATRRIDAPQPDNCSVS
jgi:hypothetical protein